MEWFKIKKNLWDDKSLKKKPQSSSPDAKKETPPPMVFDWVEFGSQTPPPIEKVLSEHPEPEWEGVIHKILSKNESFVRNQLAPLRELCQKIHTNLNEKDEDRLLRSIKIINEISHTSAYAFEYALSHGKDKTIRSSLTTVLGERVTSNSDLNMIQEHIERFNPKLSSTCPPLVLCQNPQELKTLFSFNPDLSNAEILYLCQFYATQEKKVGLEMFEALMDLIRPKLEEGVNRPLFFSFAQNPSQLRSVLSNHSDWVNQGEKEERSIVGMWCFLEVFPEDPEKMIEILSSTPVRVWNFAPIYKWSDLNKAFEGESSKKTHGKEMDEDDYDMDNFENDYHGLFGDDEDYMTNTYSKKDAWQKADQNLNIIPISSTINPVSPLSEADFWRKALKVYPLLNAQCEEGWTALHHLTMKGHQSLIPVLVEAGANPLFKTNQGLTPLDLLHSCMALSNQGYAGKHFKFSPELFSVLEKVTFAKSMGQASEEEPSARKRHL